MRGPTSGRATIKRAKRMALNHEDTLTCANTLQRGVGKLESKETIFSIGRDRRIAFDCRNEAGNLVGIGFCVSGHEEIVERRAGFGKPMAQLLLHANATATIGHSRSRDLPELARQADILVAAVGRAEIVKADWLKPGATVIDVGINRVAAPEKGEGKFKLVGDVAFAECKPVSRAISPVPGGVGPMTIAILMANTVIAAHRRAGVAAPSF
jgi:Tetrahydrofolate dehydrogenase/cyclohydrolase, NAD(P)-binding domain